MSLVYVIGRPVVTKVSHFNMVWSKLAIPVLNCYPAVLEKWEFISVV